MASISMRNLRKEFDGHTVAVDGFNLEVNDRDFIVLVGPSGCGKTTTLYMLAGLESITSGEIFIDGKCVNDIESKDRDIAMVFQSYALYPHLTVEKNLEFPLKMHKIPKILRKKKIDEVAEILGIQELLKRKPHKLSGGQQQRVAIGKAIIREPKLFLMDEPLANLDVFLRNQMRVELIRLHQKLGATFIYVTHDQVEALTLGTRVVVMKDGVIQQIGTPLEIFESPHNMFVASFIGTPKMNFIPRSMLYKKHDLYYVNVLGHDIQLDTKKQSMLHEKKVPNTEITIGIRPDKFTISEDGQFSASVDMSEFVGTDTYLHISIAARDDLVIKTATEHLNNVRTTVRFKIEPTSLYLFDDSETNIASV